MKKFAETAMVMSGRVIAVAGGAVTSIVTARYLAPSGRGQYFLAVTAAQLLAQFANLGLPSANTYFVARDRGWAPALLANSVWIACVAVPLVTALVLVTPLATVLGAATPAARLFAVVFASVLVFTLFGNALLVGLGEVKTFGFVQALMSVSVVPFMGLAIWLQAGVRGFLAATLAGSMTTAAVIWNRVRRNARGPVGFRPDAFAATFRYSTKAYIVTLAGFLVLRLNVFLLQAVAGPAQVGYYAVASQVADTLVLLPQSVAIVLFPLLSARAEGRLRTMISHAIGTAAVLAVMCAAVWVAAAPGIRFAFGARFQPAVVVLHALLPGVFLVGVLGVVSQYLAAAGFPSVVVVSWLVALAGNAVLGRGLVMRYGAVGAGLSLSVTYGALLLMFIAVVWRVERRGAAALVSRLRAA
jgi:O-antigen/teichoic acid export membrane protein